MWRAELDLSPGLHTVECLSMCIRDSIPDGATGWHSTTFTAEA